MSPEFTLFISVEAVEIKCSEAGMEVVEVPHRFLQIGTASGSHGSWKGSQTVLMCTDPVGGSNGILAGHKTY
jgi:hypothetical protein